MKVGQFVYVKHQREDLKKKEIEKIGRKYVYLKYDNGRKYDVNTLLQVTDIGAKSRIYLSKEEYDKEVLRGKLVQSLNRYEWNNLSIEKLEKIHKIINN